ncbi:hypothetical protein [Sandarakinorhabdus limnophila]|uniref:hypothetical protein n=1 Tax=Sandarakinorhabdus limnophila TaxID=210512 RepID=UPI0026EFE33F|nr:hypothetical protein [Sandarakinorhabdus limnophila]
MIAAIRPGVLNANGVSRFSRTVPATSSSVTPLTGATLTTRTGTAGAGAGGGALFSPQAASIVATPRMKIVDALARRAG